MRLGLDLALFLAVVLAAAWREPTHGILIMGALAPFVGQYWRTLYLLGATPKRASPKKWTMAVILSLILAVILAPFYQTEMVSAVDGSAESDFQVELLPLWVGMCCLSSMGLIFLVSERRKR